MALLYDHPIFLDHDTGRHPENAGRLQAIAQHLEEVGLTKRCTRPSWSPVPRETLTRVHAQAYVDLVNELSLRDRGYLDPETRVSRRSFDAALMAAGAACDAVQRVLRGEDTVALCLVRPPGHHALPSEGMGFCLFNNVAVAARMAVEEYGLRTVLIVDWDVHHGNGTQAIFWDDPSVAYFSIHGDSTFPGTGWADETGDGDGAGTTLNIPVPSGTDPSEYVSLFSSALSEFAEAIRPEIVLVSAGFDAHKNDPLGSLGLDVDDFETLTKVVRDIAAKHAQGRLVSVLEGGYDPPSLSACVEAHLRTLISEDR